MDVKDRGHRSSDFGPQSSGSEEGLSNAFEAFLARLLWVDERYRDVSTVIRDCDGLNLHFLTIKFLLLVTVPVGIVTTTGPDVAPLGTIAVM